MTVGSLLEGALALLKARPGSLAIWGLINLATTIGMAYATMLVVDAQVMAGADASGAAIGSLLLAYLAVSAISTMVYTAALRVALRPGAHGLASLRLGMDEVRQFLLALLYLIAFGIALLVIAMVLAVFVRDRSALVDGSSTAWLLYILAFVAIAFFYTRVSLSFPLTLMRRRFVVGEAWQLTVGRFRTLLGAYAVIFAVMFGLSMLAGAATGQDFFYTLFQGPNSPDAQAAALRDYRLLRHDGPDAMMMLGWVLTAAVGTIGMTVWAGATATAARELSGDVDGLTETFS
jgi:hypothetical protein